MNSLIGDDGMLLTLDDLRTTYGFSFPQSQDSSYQAMLMTAEEEVLRYAEIEQGEVEEHFKGGDAGYVLTHTPVLEVTGVKVDGEDVTYRYERRANYVALQSSGSEVVITYTCGWKEGEEPETIRTAIAFTLQHLLKLSAGKLLGINSRSTEGGTEAIEQSTPPLAVQKMLEPFRRNRAL